MVQANKMPYFTRCSRKMNPCPQYMEYTLISSVLRTQANIYDGAFW